ncbi:hypothetical protein GCM10010232_33930 [Streptomyces amakusaensis]|uniref:Uncharacterized protein n=1 Tax=Streptomyces amakusaensis TaxID=67271 RepID=A0ABW0AIW8_9ACTN
MTVVVDASSESAATSPPECRRDMVRDTGKLLLAYGHDGPWDLDDPNGENRFTVEAWGAQMELRAIQRRNREATIKARQKGRVKAKLSYAASAIPS